MLYADKPRLFQDIHDFPCSTLVDYPEKKSSLCYFLSTPPLIATASRSSFQYYLVLLNIVSDQYIFLIPKPLRMRFVISYRSLKTHVVYSWIIFVLPSIVASLTMTILSKKKIIIWKAKNIRGFQSISFLLSIQIFWHPFGWPILESKILMNYKYNLLSGYLLCLIILLRQDSTIGQN